LTAAGAARNNAAGMGTDRSLPSPVRVSPLLGLFALVAGAILLVMAARALLPMGLRPAIMGSEVGLLAPGLVALALARIPLAGALGLRPISAGILALALATALALWVASLGLIELQFTVWPPAPEYIETFRRIHEALRPRDALDALVSLLAIAILPAVCEESLFRGIVLPSLLGLGARRAIVLSALLFALIHFDLNRFVFTLVLGLALGALRLRTGSLWTPITVHAFLNATTFVSVPFLEPPGTEMPAAQPGLGALLLAAGGGMALLLMRRFPPLTPAEAPPRLET
jgi:sodium transport system permease protein